MLARQLRRHDLTAITGQPAYQQIAEDLRQKIASGVYPVESALPSTPRLMNQYRVSITAVRAAIRELQNEGVLIGQQGKGVFVARMPGDRTQAGGDIGAQLAELTAMVRQLDERVAALEKGKGRRTR